MNLKEIKTTYPRWLPDNVQYLCYMGSIAYGVSTDASDLDVYGFAIPPKEFIYPENYIHGFDSPPSFDIWTQHHVKDKEKEYDFSIYGITKYFQLVADCNPNMIDSLFVPLNCVARCTVIGQKVREARHIFLSKKCWLTFKGYAYGQLKDLTSRQTETGSKRDELIRRHQFDTKAAYHVVRLISEVEQILVEEDLVLDEKGRREHMKAIRRGDIKQEEIVNFFKLKEKDLETAYANSKLPAKVDKVKVRSLLVECLDMHYGNERVVSDSEYKIAMQNIKEIIEGLT